MKKAKELVAIVGNIDPDANGAATYNTGWVDVNDFKALLAVVQVGDVGAAGTVDAKMQQAKDASGTGAKDISGKAVTQITAADRQATISVAAGDLDVAGNYTHVRLQMTVGGNAVDSGAVVLGVVPTEGPAYLADAATVLENV